VGTIAQISRVNAVETHKPAGNIELLTNKHKDTVKAEAQKVEKESSAREYWRHHFDELLEKLNMITKVARVEFRREIHRTTGEIMVSILDSDTRELLRQIPPERVLDMLAEMMKYLGLKVDLEA
jgi:flagellar protein FlaG